MLIKLSLVLSLFIIYPAHAYIDPATGNAFFTLAITIISAILFGIQYIYEHVFMIKGVFHKNKKRSDFSVSLHLFFNVTNDQF